MHTLIRKWEDLKLPQCEGDRLTILCENENGEKCFIICSVFNVFNEIENPEAFLRTFKEWSILNNKN